MAQIAFEANLVAPAELKFAQSGKAVAKARLAENHRGKSQSGEWEDTGTTWHNVTAFGALAEKLAEVPKGSRLTVQGRQSSRAYEKDGDTRQWTETIADVFGIVPKGPQQGQSRPSPQGEQWNNSQQYGSGTGGGGQWPAAAQPGNGQQWDQSRAQQGLDQPPF